MYQGFPLAVKNNQSINQSNKQTNKNCIAPLTQSPKPFKVSERVF